ncbi:MAG TPA: hypothetical protein VFB62_05500 [Polyangiaceae bacterium]|nr:hypothetical protein [Polyangiaceae bacterium]
MNELAIPLLLVVGLYAVVVPLVTLAVKAALWLPRRAAGDVATYSSGVFYALLVAPLAAPTLWLVSAAIHASEPDAAVPRCVAAMTAERCQHLIGFAALATAVAAVGIVVGHCSRDRSQSRRASSKSSASRRLASLCLAHPALARHAARIHAVVDPADDVRTVGLFRPVIEVGSALLARLDDDEVIAALLHEREHAVALDPLRFLLAEVCLLLNPAGALLRGELRRWRLGREVACDRAALGHGADRYALASALVAAARPLPPTASSAALGCALEMVTLRIKLILGTPEPRAPRRTQLLEVVALVSCIALPHLLGDWPLDLVHREVAHLFMSMS